MFRLTTMHLQGIEKIYDKLGLFWGYELVATKWGHHGVRLDRLLRVIDDRAQALPVWKPRLHSHQGWTYRTGLICARKLVTGLTKLNGFCLALVNTTLRLFLSKRGEGHHIETTEYCAKCAYSDNAAPHILSSEGSSVSYL